MTDDSVQPASNSFVTGFTLGVLAGAAGYFLFGTERGTRLRHEMVKEWHGARERMTNEGLIDNPNLPFREAVRGALHTFAHFMQDLSLPQQTPVSFGLETKKTGRSPGRPKKSTQKFRGL